MQAGRSLTRVGRLQRFGQALEDTVLVVLLATMMILACLQILLRNGFSTGFVWGDELLRIMVLWLALAGAVAASRADRQISIDVLSRLLPVRPRLLVAALVDLFTALVCAALAWHALSFVADAREFEDTLLNGLPAWWFQSILPIGFGLMCWRYLVFAISRFILALSATPVDDAPATPPGIP